MSLRLNRYLTSKASERMDRRGTTIAWRETGDAEFPYEAQVNGERWVLRLNDFPEEEMYSLLVDGREVERFNDWPKAWKRPA